MKFKNPRFNLFFIFSFIFVLHGCLSKSVKDAGNDKNSKAIKVTNENKSPSPKAFPEFSVDKLTSNGVERVTFTHQLDQEWPAVKFSPARGFAVNSQNLVMAVLGDTGCRLKEDKNGVVYQKCNSDDEWPYAQVVKQIANENADLIVHTGDYHYREHCTNEAICKDLAPNTGYGWNAWWDDFYGPSQPLFQKAPLLFIRGNHEDCRRAYRGWQALGFQHPQGNSCVESEDVQVIEIGDLILVNLDNSMMEDRKPWSEADKSRWNEMFLKTVDAIKSRQAVSEMSKRKKEVWLLVHKPAVAYFPSPKDAEPLPIQDDFLLALKQSGLLKQIDFVLSGHIHNQQITGGGKDVPWQIVIGHSGTSLDPFGRRLMNPSIVSATITKNDFGYALLKRKGFKKWQILFKNLNGIVQQTCQIEPKKLNCD